MKTTSLLALLIFSVTMISSMAQTPDENDPNAGLGTRIVVLARAESDGVLLRWAVDKPAVWQEAMESGYFVDRAEASVGNRLPAPSSFQPVSGTAILPWKPEQWQGYFSAAPPVPDDQPDYPMFAAALSEKDEGVTQVNLEDLAAFQEQKSRFEMRFGLALYAADRNAIAAEALGLRFLDRSAERGKTYVYRVRLAKPSSVYRVDTGFVRVANVPRDPVKHQLVTATENDGWILLSWPAARWSATRVERSTDNGKTFASITRVPLISVRAPGSPDSSESFADTLVTNYRPYVYRVHGATPFADEELIGEVHAMGRDRTPPGMPFVPNAKQTAARAVRVQWNMDDPVAADLAGFTVLRSAVEDGEYLPLTTLPLPKNAREFIDTTFSDYDPNYYIVAALDTAGNVASSMPSYVAIVDSTAPSVPRWLKGTMDSTGVVTLTLRTNPERDVMGYRILRANAPDHEFSSVMEHFGNDGMSAVRDTVLKDTVTVRSLTKNVYYRATALDFHFNESEFSDILTVARPDKVPPVAPVITGVDVTDSSVTLAITPGGSPDVARHLLFRRISGEAAWGPPRELPADASDAYDRDVKSNVTYEYAMQAVDSAGNASELSMSMLARPYENAVLPAVTNLALRFDEEKKQMLLNWEYARDTEGLRFMVYRSVNGAGLMRYAVVSAPSGRMYTDAALPVKGMYEYAVKAITPSGAESAMSASVKAESR